MRINTSITPLSHPLNIKHFGQIFTPAQIVNEMIRLRKNKGSVLEPACGDGAFLKKLNQVIGLEIDKSLTRKENVLHKDFFSYSVKNKFNTIIGNPPYVRFQDIVPQTKKLLNMEWFDYRSNLYLFFIAKSIQHLNKHGELIFITPREFIKLTSAKTLNSELYKQGSFTYYRETGDDLVFNGYAPNCAIWRWEKGLFHRRVAQNTWFNCQQGQIWFGKKHQGRLGDFFNVKVGAVSGADPIFTHKKYGNVDMVCSFTAQTGKTRRMIYNQQLPYLLKYKKKLLQRKIRMFNDSNWWEWGRKYCDTPHPRIYVNCKTRHPKPFFSHKSLSYDGAVLALFPYKKNMDIPKAVHELNNIDWGNLGFSCGGRLLFSQNSLLNAPVELKL